MPVGPVASSVPFDNSTNGFSSDNCQDAIEESKRSSFSWYIIPIGLTVKIDQYREMIVTQAITISGTLIVSGRLTII